ncbi:MAG: hypothetical protein IJU41_06290 [Clostridia bacterium]|nr:hypothetical protein [Clostridia bacterium]
MLKLSPVFGSHMVLQANSPIRIFGQTDKNAVKVIFDGQEKNAAVNDGAFSVDFPARPSDCAPKTLTACDGEETVTLSDILIGEVWLIYGQSNAELTFGDKPGYAEYYKNEIAAADARRPIRAFLQRRRDAAGKTECTSSPQTMRLADPARRWEALGKGSDFSDCSMLGYFFALSLCRGLDQRTPVGFVTCASGGSKISELMPRALCDKLGLKSFYKEDMPLASVYNSLLHPFLSLGFAGMVFYQGESNIRDFLQYPVWQNALVKELRKEVGRDFPFLFVQISSHGLWEYERDFRYAQWDALLQSENCYMIPAHDVGFVEGEPDRPHPQRKAPLGQRLAATALYYVYGKTAFADKLCPTVERVIYTQDYVDIRFGNVGGGLAFDHEDADLGFEVRSGWTWKAPVSVELISPDTLRLVAPHPTAVRNLYKTFLAPDFPHLRAENGDPVPAFCSYAAREIEMK